MKVLKVADVIDRELILSVGRPMAGDLIAILSNLDEVSDANKDSAWSLEFEIGKGAAARVMKLDLPPILRNSDPVDAPVFLAGEKLAFFRNRLFLIERAPKSPREREEIVLRVKKAAYDEDAEFAGLRAAVANLEAVVEMSRSGQRREAIPEDVKLLVWTRDGGSCVRCGATQNLHFDHVIPFAKGGGNSEANIQILCQTCNLKKSDRIATS